MPLAESLRQSLDRFADHHDLMQHGGLRLEAPRKASFVMPWIKVWIRRAALAISRRVASSRDIACLIRRDHHLGRVQNGLTAYPVGTPFQGAFANQVDGTVQQAGQFLLHLDVGQEPPVCIVMKGDEDIDTVRAKVGP
jgi:hypothetical protein